MAETSIVKSLISDDLLRHDLRPGETSHDYEMVFLMPAHEISYWDGDRYNASNVIRMRCKNCGKVIAPSSEVMREFQNKYGVELSYNRQVHDWDQVVFDLPTYQMKEGEFFCEIKYIPEEELRRVTDV